MIHAGEGSRSTQRGPIQRLLVERRGVRARLDP
jgi:hypothetical protein